MSLIMSEIHPVTRKLFALELLKIAVLNLVSLILKLINLDQSCKVQGPGLNIKEF